MIFLVILRILDLTVKPLFKLSQLCLFSFSWKIENWEASTKKAKNSNSIKSRYFNCLIHSLFYGPLQLDKSCFQKIHLFKLNLIPRGARLLQTIVLNLMYTLLYRICCTIWNLEEYQLLLTVIITVYFIIRRIL